MQIYQVGGAVRDKILGKAIQDTDHVVIGSSETEMIALGYQKVGKHFPVFLHPQTHEEYALARKEIKTAHGHKGFQFIFTPDITLEEDSLRRDFTCNAIYYNPETNEYFDFHKGMADIEKRILRHISSHFSEDPLRVLRMCRFVAQLDFTVAPETMSLCKQMVSSGELSYLSPERIWQEIMKATKTEYFDKFILTAKESGALAYILPEVSELWQIPERQDYHPERNTGNHVILCLQSAHSNDSLLNFAILLHDIGKIKTDKTQWPSHHHHDELGVEVIKEICHRLHIPNRYRDFAVFCARNHMVSHQSLSANRYRLAQIATELADKFTAKDMERLLLLMRADLCGRQLTQVKLDNFNIIAEALRQLYHTAKKIKLSSLPEFPKMLAKLQAHEITSEEMYAYRVKTILNKTKLSV